MRLSYLILLLILLSQSISIRGQQNSLRSKKIAYSSEPIKIDSLSIFPNSFEIMCNGFRLDSMNYELNFEQSALILKSNICDSFTVNYRVFQITLTKPYQKRSESLIYSNFSEDREKFLISQNYSVDDVFGGSEISKQGSISRGVSFGNNQDLGINSSLNLELSGQISPNMKILASISDANIPIQPDGTTNKLQEFDQLYIQLYNDNLKLIAGDFWLYKPEGYFLTYRKRAQGLTSSFNSILKNNQIWKTQISGALSKGKFNRQIIQGIESNQGPYRLKGSENEPFIIVLAGTERIFIDGKLLDRGQELDYTIDYNTSEIIFTSRNLITKDSRIVAEFQYSDQNFARSLVQASTGFESNKLKFWINTYSEQDAKNQSLQQKLSVNQKNYLSSIGDSLQLAQISSIDSVGFFQNQILYKLVDSLGYDSILVYSNHPDSAKFSAVFIQVGANKGNYIFDQQIAFGKIYRWVEPINGIPQGDFSPARLIATPKKKQFLSSGFNYALSKTTNIYSEFGLSNEDKNTFSSIGNNDNMGYSGMINIKNIIPLTRNSTNKIFYENQLFFEILNKNFSPIEQFRAVEFDRDWNVRNMNYTGLQSLTQIQNSIKSSQFGKINLDYQRYSIGNNFYGNRFFSTGDWNQKGWKINWDASFLNSNSDLKNNFIRHRSQITKKLGIFQLGYKDDQELNVFKSSSNMLQSRSYEFFDYQFYISSIDSAKTTYKISYRERYDWKPINTSLKPAAKATTSAFELHLNGIKNNRVTLISGLRNLKIIDSSLITQQPENTLIGRIEYDAKYWKNTLVLSTFYEVGSGLEQRRDFIYLKVNDGQGVYTWIDYDQDGVEDLNEFEIAQFVDQASYVRIFIPSSQYSKTYTNEFNGSIFIKPEKLVSKNDKIFKHLGLFSNQARIRIMKKVSNLDYKEFFNPFQSEIRDSNLVSNATNIRNSLFFNRNSPIFGMEYNFQDIRSKTLLASGFDSRENFSNEIALRWNLTKSISFFGKLISGTKTSIIDYTINRNYQISFRTSNIEFAFQPSTNYRIGASFQYDIKRNSEEFGSETGNITQFNINAKYNESKKGSLLADIKTVFINFDGNSNSAVSFEMMEGLKPGMNNVISISYQRLLSKNLQISIQYLGRKSEATRIIHTGGMELRALF